MTSSAVAVPSPPPQLQPDSIIYFSQDDKTPSPLPSSKELTENINALVKSLFTTNRLFEHKIIELRRNGLQKVDITITPDSVTIDKIIFVAHTNIVSEGCIPSAAEPAVNSKDPVTPVNNESTSLANPQSALCKAIIKIASSLHLPQTRKEQKLTTSVDLGIQTVGQQARNLTPDGKITQDLKMTERRLKNFRPFRIRNLYRHPYRHRYQNPTIQQHRGNAS